MPRINAAEQTLRSTQSGRSTPVRLLLVDDDERVLDEMSSLLSGSFEIAGRAHDGEQMIVEAARLHPDVIVADISMPNLDGISATRFVLSRDPNALVVLFTMHRESDVVHRAFQSGVRGYVYKLQDTDEVVTAIHSVLRGEIFVSPRGLSEQEN